MRWTFLRTLVYKYTFILLVSFLFFFKSWNHHSRVLLPFGSPYEWHAEWTEKLQERFQRVTIPILRQRGAKWMCWILAREQLGYDYKATQFGGNQLEIN